MKILFIGCVESSYVLLKELIDNNIKPCGVITKKQSCFNSDFVDLSQICIKNGIDVFYTENSRDKKTYNYIKNKEPDVIYCFGWSYLLSQEIIEIPEKGVIGFHPSKLPQNKGRHPLIWALVLGLEETASTFFMIDRNIDSGPIISQKKIDIDFFDTSRTLYDKVMCLAKKQLLEITDLISEGNLEYQAQDVEKSNHWRKRNKNDGLIDFRMSSIGIYNLVRALTKPYPGAIINHSLKEYRVWSTEIIQLDKNVFSNIEPGKVLEVYSKSSFLVKTGDGAIKVNEADDIELKKGDYLL